MPLASIPMKLFSITFAVGVILSGLCAWSGTYTPTPVINCEVFPEITLRSPTPGPPIRLFELSISTPVLFDAAVSPVGSVPMKQPATCTFPAAVMRTPSPLKFSMSSPKTFDPCCRDR